MQPLHTNQQGVLYFAWTLTKLAQARNALLPGDRCQPVKLVVSAA